MQESIEKGMNVLVIPSWYPSRRQPLAGIFIKEQLEAVADLSRGTQVYVSLPPDDRGQITPLRPFSVFSALWWYLRSKKITSTTTTNHVTGVSHPALSWSSRFGGMRWLIGYHRRNLEHLLQLAGSIDLLHAHVSYPCGHVARVLSEEFRIPFIITEHMGPFPFRHLMAGGRPRKEISQAFGSAAETIAVSSALATRIASFGYRQPVVIPNMVDERRFDVTKQRSREKFVFFSLSILSDQKGIDTLLEAISIWDPPPQEVEFRIGGHGPKLSYYRRMAVKLGVSDKIKWPGHVSREEAPRRFQEADAFVLPSRHESFGVVYAEAIASGLPVIATRCGGPEYIVNDTNGRLVGTGNAEALANAMKEVYRDYPSFSPDRIREDFMNRFSRGAVVPQIIQVYQKVISDHR